MESLSADGDLILSECSNEITELMRKVMDDVDNPMLLKLYMKFNIKHPVSTELPPTAGPLKGIIEFQSWRRLSKSGVLDLKNKHELNEYEYSAICLDWIEKQRPRGKDVLELYQSIKQGQVEYNYLMWLNNMLRDVLGYNNIPRLHALAHYEYDYQWWSVSKQQLQGALDNNVVVQLPSRGARCPAVNIRLVKSANKVNVQVEVADDITANQHTHRVEEYNRHSWYLLGLGNNGRYTLYPFYTKTFTEITEFVNRNYQNCGIYCFVTRKD